MTRPASPKVLTEGARTFIQVPSDTARSLHTYLRRHCVVCAPPDQCHLATACNRCHQAFHVDVTVRAFSEPKP